jgi:hypothetical protein
MSCRREANTCAATKCGVRGANWSLPRDDDAESRLAFRRRGGRAARVASLLPERRAAELAPRRPEAHTQRERRGVAERRTRSTGGVASSRDGHAAQVTSRRREADAERGWRRVARGGRAREWRRVVGRRTRSAGGAASPGWRTGGASGGASSRAARAGALRRVAWWRTRSASGAASQMTVGRAARVASRRVVMMVPETASPRSGKSAASRRGGDA